MITFNEYRNQVAAELVSRGLDVGRMVGSPLIIDRGSLRLFVECERNNGDNRFEPVQVVGHNLRTNKVVFDISLNGTDMFGGYGPPSTPVELAEVLYDFVQTLNDGSLPRCERTQHEK